MEEKKGAKTLAQRIEVMKPRGEYDGGPEKFEIKGDDANQTLMWRSMMKDCAFYYESPTIGDTREMRTTL